MQNYYRVHVQLGKKDRQQLGGMLTKGRESARVLRRASILRQLDGGQKAAQVAANVGVAAKTVRAVARRLRGGRAGVGSARKAETRQAASAGCRPEPADHRHGVRFAATGQRAVERTADRRGSGKAEAGATGGPGDNPHPASGPRAEAVAGKKAGASRN